MRGREGLGGRREGEGGREEEVPVLYQLFALPADSFIKFTRSSLASFHLCYLSVGCIVKSALNCLKLWQFGWLLGRLAVPIPSSDGRRDCVRGLGADYTRPGRRHDSLPPAKHKNRLRTKHHDHQPDAAHPPPHPPPLRLPSRHRRIADACRLAHTTLHPPPSRRRPAPPPPAAPPCLYSRRRIADGPAQQATLPNPNPNHVPSTTHSSSPAWNRVANDSCPTVRLDARSSCGTCSSW
jgi:hypothetical protein